MKHYLLEDLMEKVLKMNDEVEERTTRVANNLTREISTMKESLEETEDLKANFKHIVNMCERKLDAASLESIYDALKMMVTKDQMLGIETKLMTKASEDKVARIEMRFEIFQFETDQRNSRLEERLTNTEKILDKFISDSTASLKQINQDLLDLKAE